MAGPIPPIAADGPLVGRWFSARSEQPAALDRLSKGFWAALGDGRSPRFEPATTQTKVALASPAALAGSFAGLSANRV